MPMTMKVNKANHTPVFTPKNIIWGFFGLIIVAAVVLFGKFSPSLMPAVRPQILAIVPPSYAHVSLAARAAYVLDGNTGKELWSFNGYSQLPLASLTKIMTAVTALSLVPEDTVVTINQSFLKSEGDSGLYGNERWRLKDLLDLTLLESSNDGANAIAATAWQVAGEAKPRVVNSQIAVALTPLKQESPAYDFDLAQFVTAMNQKALELGLIQTFFINPTGLDESASVSGGYGSARDVAMLFSYALHTYPKLLEVTRDQTREFISLNSIKHKVKNTNVFVGNIPSLLGSKTGYTDLAGGNLVVAFDAGPNHPIIISVLGSTERGRFDDAEKLVWATLEYLSQNI